MGKVFIYGNKNNPEGVKKALERHGVDCSTPFQESFRKALADPHTILFNGTDAYGKPGHVGWYKDDNLACVPMVYHEEGWIQIFPSKKEKFVDLNRMWRPMGSEPIDFTDDKKMVTFILWDGNEDYPKVSVMYCNKSAFHLLFVQGQYQYWAYMKDFIPHKADLSSGI